MHSALPTCQPPFLVRSLKLVEVRPYAKEEEEEEEEEVISAISTGGFGGFDVDV